MDPSLERLARDVRNIIDEELMRTGFLFRIFSRAKTSESIEKKIKFKRYSEKKLMQDCIGIRITLYFADDALAVYGILKNKANFIDETVDQTEETVFKPSRVNLIFNLESNMATEINHTLVSKYKYIDTTYEVQIRTVLSEGWHEVDHDLRYKCPEDWIGQSDLARVFNGVYASLVTSDWSILTVFEQLSYRHYKNKNWAGMLRNKFRLRFKENTLSPDLIVLLDNDPEIAKTLYRIDRMDYLRRVIGTDIRIPLTLNNLVYLLNIFYLKSSSIDKMTPEFIRKYH